MEGFFLSVFLVEIAEQFLDVVVAVRSVQVVEVEGGAGVEVAFDVGDDAGFFAAQ